MEASWVLVAVILSIYSYYWYRRPSKNPPGPRGIPILGYVPFLGKYPERIIFQLSKRYGSIMSVRMGTNDQIFLNSYDAVVKAFVKQPNIFAGKPHNPIFHRISQGQGLTFVDYGEKWKSQRRFGMMTLRGLGVGKKSMEKRITEELDYLNDSIRSHDEKPFDISIPLRKAITNNICCIIMGTRFEYDDSRFRKIMEGVFQFFEDPSAGAVFRILVLAPPLRHLPIFSTYYRRLLDNLDTQQELLDVITDEHEDTFDNGNLRDFIDAFIKEKKDKRTYFTKLQLIQFVSELLVAGSETTSSILSWCLLCCLHYPQAQEKLRNEITKVLDADCTISMSKKIKLPYVSAFIEEVYRFRIPSPLGLPHMNTEDTEIDGYFIPKNTTVFANLWAVNNDEEFWNEPQKFRPERFLDENGNFIPSNHVMTFGVGPRNCLGEQLARMEVFVFLVGMIQKFEFLPDPDADQLPDIDKGSNGQFFVPLPYKIVARQL